MKLRSSAKAKEAKKSPKLEQKRLEKSKKEVEPVESEDSSSDEAPAEDEESPVEEGLGFIISTEPCKDIDDESDEGHDDDDDEIEEQVEPSADKDPEPSSKPEPLENKNTERHQYSEAREKTLASFLFGPDLYDDKEKVKEKDADVHKKKRKAAWVDKEDETTMVKDVAATFKRSKADHGKKTTSTQNYAETLKKKFVSIMGAPAWASLEKNDQPKDDDSDDEFFRETTSVLANDKRAQLEKGLLEYRKLKDLNYESHNEGALIKATEFHPKAQIALVAGHNGTASLFKVDGKTNPKIQSVNFQDFPIQTAHFDVEGDNFFVSSRFHSHFFAYDLHKGITERIRLPKNITSNQGGLASFHIDPARRWLTFQGRFGEFHFLNIKTRDVTFTLKANSSISALAFSPSGDEIYSHTAEGEVYVWDIRSTRSCQHKFVDDGCVRGTTLAISPNNQYIATGSNSGIVNLYEKETALSSMRPQPLKIVSNLTTSIHHLKFNPTSEILALASESKENAIKMMHVPSRTVFSNFPPLSFNLKRVNSLDFSLNGGFFSVGNNKGAANLYRLKHFLNY